MHRLLTCGRTVLVAAALAGCAPDASLDLTVVSWDGRALDAVDVVVCNARHRAEVIETVSLGGSTASSVSVPADGQAVAFAATTPDGALCAASCQLELDEGATFEGTLTLVPCRLCPATPPSPTNVCRDPLCFVDEADLSACE